MQTESIKIAPVVFIYTNQTLCSFATEWPVTDRLSLAGELVEEEWIEKRGCEKDEV